LKSGLRCLGQCSASKKRPTVSPHLPKCSVISSKVPPTSSEVLGHGTSPVRPPPPFPGLLIISYKGLG